jgi:lipoyl(octanoyl) transferase
MVTVKPKVFYQDLGNVSYQKAWDYQKELHSQLIARKLRNRDSEIQQPQEHFLLFCDHPHVYTLGKSGSLDHLLLSEEEMDEKNIEFFKINRGGDITYHGPGQIVGYPIFDLDFFFNDVHKYVRFLEESIMKTLEEYGIESMRDEGFTGVWLPAKGVLPKRKICAIGVHLSRWITMHGFAFNVNSDLNFFKHIVPCGINDADKDVTSLAFELGQNVDIQEVKEKVKRNFALVFGYEYGKELIGGI